MAIVADGDILEARLVSHMQNQSGINVRHYGVSGVIGVVTTQECADSISNNFAATYKASMCDLAEFRGVGVKRLLPVPAGEDVDVSDAGQATLPGEPLPKQVCGLITLRTGLPGRGNRGRVYVPFPTEDDNDTDGTPVAAYLALLVALSAKFIAQLTPPGAAGGDQATLTPIVYHRALGLGTAITSALGRDRWATQRSRGDFGAMNTPPF